MSVLGSMSTLRQNPMARLLISYCMPVLYYTYIILYLLIWEKTEISKTFGKNYDSMTHSKSGIKYDNSTIK